MSEPKEEQKTKDVGVVGELKLRAQETGSRPRIASPVQ